MKNLSAVAHETGLADTLVELLGGSTDGRDGQLRLHLVDLLQSSNIDLERTLTGETCRLTTLG